MAKGGERDRPEELYSFAEALVRKMKVRHQLQWSEHRVEDAIQDLYFADWQVWQDEEDVGLAKNGNSTFIAARISRFEVTTKRKPFDFFVERLDLKKSRDDRI